MKTERLSAAILWRRLNETGADAMRLWRRGDGGWLITGSAVFLEGGRIAELAYQVECDGEWRTRWGRASGHLGGREIAIDVRATGGGWTCNGRAVPDVAGCLDFDLNFTPATNLISFRRLRLKVGECADVPVAWLKVPEFELQRLPQRVERIDAGTYDYAAPTAGYAGRLKVDENEFVLEYPELWVAEKVERYEV